MALSPSMPHHSQQQRPMDPRKRWNINHTNYGEVSDGGGRSEGGELHIGDPHQQRQQWQQQQQSHQHCHPKFRHRFQSAAALPATLPSTPSELPPQGFQQRFQPPPHHPPPPSPLLQPPQQQQQQHPSLSSENCAQTSNGEGFTDRYKNLSGRGDGHGKAVDPRATATQIIPSPAPTPSLTTHGSAGGPLKSQWQELLDEQNLRIQKATQQKKKEHGINHQTYGNARTLVPSYGGKKGAPAVTPACYGKHEMPLSSMPASPATMPPPKPPFGVLTREYPPLVPPSTVGTLPDFAHPPPTGAPPTFAEPSPPPLPINKHQPASEKFYSEQQPRHQTAPQDKQQQYHRAPPQDYHVSPSPHPDQNQQSYPSLQSNHNTSRAPSPSQQHHQQQKTHQFSSQKITKLPPPPPDPAAQYTLSLHWKISSKKDRTPKQPIDLPTDVEHITEVEWAGDSASTTHTPHFASSSTNVPSMHTNMEKAPRPKPRRPEPCFCEPDVVTQQPCCVDTTCALFACQEECTTSCAAGPLCGNKRIQRKQWKKLSVFDAGLKGRGLMVQERCQPGDFIVEYVGVAVKKRHLDSLFSRYKSERMLYIMALDGDVYIDARHRGGIARYINHSCEPNCVVHRWKVRGISRACVFALREIEEGEELSFDYQWERKRGRALTKCHCGSEKCRGTIEEDNFGSEYDDLDGREGGSGIVGGGVQDSGTGTHSGEEASVNHQWVEQPAGSNRTMDIMNRVVKVYHEHPQENSGKYYVADVAHYNPSTKKHLLMYRGDSEEHWTDLSVEKWMLLKESGVDHSSSGYNIARKGGSSDKISLLINNLPPPTNHWPVGLGPMVVTSPRYSDGNSRTSSPTNLPGGKVLNYTYVQTPVKDSMVQRHALFKCATLCRVHIDTAKVTIPHGGESDEDEHNIDGMKKKAFDESEDGCVWKFIVTGMEVKKAIDWLEKVAVSTHKDLQNGGNGGSSAPLDTLNTGLGSPPPSHMTEVVIPRIVVDEVKKRYFNLKGYCYNTDMSFSHSDSKSKQFAKLTLCAELEGDLHRTLEYLNKELTQMCHMAGAPITSIGVYRDFGFLGGEISSDDFHRLFFSPGSATKANLTECSEDLRRSTFATSFEEANRCSIWVQAEEDMGRVSHHRVINEADPNKPRKVYFGVAPSRVGMLWEYFQKRVADLHRGVRFLHLGPDRIYQHALMEPIRRNRPRPSLGDGSDSGPHGHNDWNYFFDFVAKTSGASVRIDSVTGSSHLRIDGGDVRAGGDAGSRAVNKKIDVAIELIRLQIELLRDHHIRKQRWGFGRDWALLLENDPVRNNNKCSQAAAKGGEGGLSGSTVQEIAASSKHTNTADSLRLSDLRTVGAACLEISEIVTGAGLSERVAAHACIIFYRYINLLLPSQNTNINENTLNTSFKLRDIQLASLFIANKSQKVIKWKRLEAVLEYAYKVFYPGAVFNSESEEAKNWEMRVIKAEKTVLSALNYDVFWPGADWVINAVVGTKAMAEPLAENAMALALSGYVLAAGPVLWLKYGPKYAFAAIAGFLSIDIEPLFPALSLQPLTVSHAAELIYHSCQALSRVKKSVALHSKHELFSDNKVSLMGTNIQQVQKICAMYISKHQGQIIDDSEFVSSPAYKEISGRAKLRRVFPGVESNKIESKILPVLAKICFESKCTIRFSYGHLEGTNDIVLEGNWKALSIAEHLVCAVASLRAPVPFEQLAAHKFNSIPASIAANTMRMQENKVIKQVKIQPGILEMKKIDGKHGWYGTFDDSSEKPYDVGWKTCLAANAPQEHLDSAGLRWWVPHQYGPSLSGSLCEIFSSPKIISCGSIDMRALALMAQTFAGGYSRLKSQYPALSSFLTDPEGEVIQECDRSVVAISLQRWPPEKIEAKERSAFGQNMQMGYSVAALQEMQLLHQLHFLIPSPQGHPNFILPLAVALDPEIGNEDGKELSASPGSASSSNITSNSKAANDILAMIERNQRAVGKRQLVSGSHLVLEPTPINLQKVMSHYQRKNNRGTVIPPTVLASWCHDILSAISFCHSNHIILRSLLPDQIHLDHSGTAKLSGLSKVMVLHGKDRTKDFDPLRFVRPKKGKDHSMVDVEPFAAPELLLGGTRHTKETDMWAFGALLANLLLGKQLFPGKDRVSKMTQVFKIVGVPDKDNYKRAKEFPFYSNNMYVIGDEGKKKKYSRGVEKAVRHMLRAFSTEHESKYSGLISLIDGLLHLDPKKRMTADEALGHQYIMNFSAQIERQEFCQNYVTDWLDLKENVLTKGKSPKSTIRDTFVSRSKTRAEQHKRKTPPQMIGDSAAEQLRMNAYSINASTGGSGPEDVDDLYNLDDLLGTSRPKKSKLSET